MRTTDQGWPSWVDARSVNVADHMRVQAFAPSDGVLPEAIVIEAASTHAENRVPRRRETVAGEVVQRGNELATSQVAGRTEDDQGLGGGEVYALPLSKRGLPVSAIELSPHMADGLRAKPGADAVPVTSRPSPSIGRVRDRQHDAGRASPNGAAEPAISGTASSSPERFASCRTTLEVSCVSTPMSPVPSSFMPFEQSCPRCGADFTGDDKDAVADAVVEHARVVHRHALDRDVVLAHLEGVHPHDRES